jgi:hypothetical protein
VTNIPKCPQTAAGILSVKTNHVNGYVKIISPHFLLKTFAILSVSLNMPDILWYWVVETTIKHRNIVTFFY